MAAASAEDGRSDPVFDGATWVDARGSGPPARHGQPCQRGIARPQGIEPGDGPALARPLSRAGRPASGAADRAVAAQDCKTRRGVTFDSISTRALACALKRRI